MNTPLKRMMMVVAIVGAFAFVAMAVTGVWRPGGAVYWLTSGR